MQSIWIPVRGVQKELDDAKLRFAAADVFGFFFLLTRFTSVTVYLDEVHLRQLAFE